MERRNQAHIFGGSFFIFLAAGSKHGMLIFLLGGTKSLSQALVICFCNVVCPGETWCPVKDPWGLGCLSPLTVPLKRKKGS